MLINYPAVFATRMRRSKFRDTLLKKIFFFRRPILKLEIKNLNGDSKGKSLKTSLNNIVDPKVYESPLSTIYQWFLN